MLRWFVIVALTGACGCASSPSEPNAMSTDPEYSALRRRVAESEFLQVIVGVRVAPQPTEDAIRSAQDELIASLPAGHVEVASRFEVIPFVVLRVDAAGLDALIASPLVTSIEEDVASPSSNR